MALNFPSSPSNGQEYVAPNGITYIYDAAAGLWYVKTSDAIGTSDIADSAITTAKLADDSVTTAKIAGDVSINTTGDLTANSLTLPTAPVVGYQQGSWTPTCDRGSLTDVAANCIWMRIGNQVTVYGLVRNLTDRSSNAVAIEGLPYPAPNAGVSAGRAFYIGATAGFETTYVSSSNIQFYKSDSGSSFAVGAMEYSDTTDNFDIYFGATYLTDDTTWTPINNATVS
ncbi:hypothetical protein [Synechococcus phage MA10]